MLRHNLYSPASGIHSSFTLNPCNEFVYSFRLKDLVIILDVALIVDFDNNVAIALCQDPVCDVIGRVNNRLLIFQMLILTEIKITRITIIPS